MTCRKQATGTQSHMQFTQDNPMTQFTNNAQDSETASQYASIRRAELTGQRWNRSKSTDLAAMNLGVSLYTTFPLLESGRLLVMVSLFCRA